MELNSFTFPTTTQPCQTDSSSSPLWHVISSNPRLSASQSLRAVAPEDTTSSSLCDMADHARLNEEKMDMLWEDFNEELRFERNPPSPDSHPSLDFSKEMVQFGCASVMRPTRSRKPSNHSAAVSFFKNLFLNHHSHQSRSKRHSPH